MSSIQPPENLAWVQAKGQVNVEVLPGSLQAGKGAFWVCFDTAIAGILVISSSCSFGGCAVHVLLLLTLVKLHGRWLIMAYCPAHLSFCPVRPSQFSCVHLPTSWLVSAHNGFGCSSVLRTVPSRAFLGCTRPHHREELLGSTMTWNSPVFI